MSDKKLKTPCLTVNGVKQLQEKNWKLYRIEELPDGGIVEKELSNEEIQQLLSLAPTPTQQDIRIYPNPTSDYLYITGLVARSIVTLYTSEGEEILSTITGGDGDVKLYLAALPHGVYYLQIARHSYPVVVTH